MSNPIKEVLSTLSGREKRALKEAVSVIYLNDSSDYINGLWGVIDALIGDYLDDEYSVDELKEMLNTEEV